MGNVEWYIENEKCEEMHISMKELFELIPKNLRYAAGGTELADLLWVINGTSSLLQEIWIRIVMHMKFGNVRGQYKKFLLKTWKMKKKKY